MNKKPYSFFSVGFFRSYLITMRPYLLFVSGAAALVGLAFIPSQPVWRLVLGFIPMFLSYGFGQALTDCFQTDTDAISSPYRPLVRGVITRKQVLITSLVGLGTGVAIMSYLNYWILVFGVAAVAGLLTYTWLKRTWWGGPPWNSWIVALLPIMGRLVDKGYQLRTFFGFSDSYTLVFFLGILAVFFGYVNFVVMGYFKDISADAKTGYNTFQVKFGWIAGAIYSDVVAAAIAVLTGWVIYLVGFASFHWLNLLGIAVYLTALGINIFAQIKIHLTRDEAKSHGPIANVVRAFILYCLAIVLTLRPHWIWIVCMAVFYGAFELVLRLRPEKTQV